jgi:hypothetical protein
LLSAALVMLLAAAHTGASEPPLLLGPVHGLSRGAAARTTAKPQKKAPAETTLELRLAAQPPLVPPPAANPPDAALAPPSQVPLGPEDPATPLLDMEELGEETLPGVDPEDVRGPVGVRPYGGGHPTDWSWGCGGSPYRTYGRCDNWKVGPDWHVSVDGMVMSRENADLGAIATLAEADGMSTTPLDNPVFEQFDFGPGGRVTFMSQVPHYIGYQIQAHYEGIEDWNSSIVYEKQPLPAAGIPFPPVYPPPAPDLPPGFPEGTEQRSIYYRSSYHSGELNWVRHQESTWQPYCGVRYIKFDDTINDYIDQQRQPPLAGPRDLVDVAPGAEIDLVFPPIGPVITTDRRNLFALENNLMGFQLGLIHDSWRMSERFALEGFVNGGLYYNKIKFTNTMGVFTTQEFADNTNSDLLDESRIDFSNARNRDSRDLSEIAYSAEASLSGVCRLNKCWALRAGYQCLWLENVHLAEDAYLNNNQTDGRSLFFHGWHAGIECRR